MTKKIENTKNLYLITLGMILAFSMLLSACVDKPATVESLIESNDEIAEKIHSTAEDSGMTVEIKGNEILYSYDLSGIEGASKETLKDKAMISSLQNALDEQKSRFGEACKSIEETSGIEGVTAIINLTFNGEVIATSTYTSADV